MLINCVEIGLWEALKVLASALAELGAILLLLTDWYFDPHDFEWRHMLSIIYISSCLTLPARAGKYCGHEVVTLTHTWSDPETKDGLSVRPFHTTEAPNIIPR